LYELPRPVRRIAALGSSWSLDSLPTPTARLGDKRGMPSRELALRRLDRRTNLEDAVALLPTPTSSDRFGAGDHGEGGSDLRTTIELLPTPARRDYKGHAGPGGHGRDLPSALLPTPTRQDSEASRNRTANRTTPTTHIGSTLLDAISELPGAGTPTPSSAGSASSESERRRPSTAPVDD
jgi:hypothetical protein